MTVGKEVSALLPDVINCMQTDNLGLTKLACEDPNPLFRDIAVRTNGCI